ncbi:MAG: hypothetical protein JXR96_09120 [Deltaproteobacteria bacterium]|nr:hypothetical protein [Deltaproteobacteria bacterium]
MILDSLYALKLKQGDRVRLLVKAVSVVLDKKSPAVDPIRHERQKGRLRSFLNRHRRPRLTALLMVTATGAVGLLVSFLLLRIGLALDAPVLRGLVWPLVRWPLAVIVAYLAFLLMVRLWIRHETHRGTVARALLGEEPEPDPCSGAKDSTRSQTLDGLDIGFGDDELSAILFLLLAAVVALGAGVYVVVIAPELLTELLLDAAVSAGLYRRLRKTPGGDWFSTAWRRTRMPFLLVLGLFTLAGLLVKFAFPEAHSLREILHSLGGE